MVDDIGPDLERASLAGQVAVVTGGGRGLGREVAHRLAAEGARVGVVARSPDQVQETVKLIEGTGGQALGFATDITDSNSVRRMIAAVQSEFGLVDLLINNAAVITPIGPAWEADVEEWWRLFEINVYGAFVCTHAVLPGMISRGSGRIVNVASGAGIESPPFGSAYVSSKAALIRLTEALAIETQDRGVAVFAIDPGWLSTAMAHHLAYSEQGKRWTPWAASLFGTEEEVPLERGAELVVTLASGRADGLTGRFISVRDDLETLIRRVDDIRGKDLHRVRLRRE
jgi:NAD(P)-dependent dehydrogenase (short-subunit alcohol dehydrogenase family)